MKKILCNSFFTSLQYLWWKISSHLLLALSFKISLIMVLNLHNLFYNFDVDENGYLILNPADTTLQVTMICISHGVGENKMQGNTCGRRFLFLFKIILNSFFNDGYDLFFRKLMRNRYMKPLKMEKYINLNSSNVAI